MTGQLFLELMLMLFVHVAQSNLVSSLPSHKALVSNLPIDGEIGNLTAIQLEIHVGCGNPHDRFLLFNGHSKKYKSKDHLIHTVVNSMENHGLYTACIRGPAMRCVRDRPHTDYCFEFLVPVHKGIRTYELRTCLLRISHDSKKMCQQEQVAPTDSIGYDFGGAPNMSHHTPDNIRYGFRHAFMMIQESNTCYDWGNWESEGGSQRELPCSHIDIKCCVDNSRKESSGTTMCASRVGEFQKAWTQTGINYRILTWNCQQ